MRLYLDQMLRAELADRLRACGHDVIRAVEVGDDRADDARILERAMQERRALVTLDEHFGDWAVLPLAKHPGEIRLKAHPPTVENIAALLLRVLAGRTEAGFQNRLVIISPRRVRWTRTAD